MTNTVYMMPGGKLLIHIYRYMKHGLRELHIFIFIVGKYSMPVCGSLWAFDETCVPCACVHLTVQSVAASVINIMTVYGRNS